jgi:hypothetical protein
MDADVEYKLVDPAIVNRQAFGCVDAAAKNGNERGAATGDCDGASDCDGVRAGVRDGVLDGVRSGFMSMNEIVGEPAAAGWNVSAMVPSGFAVTVYVGVYALLHPPAMTYISKLETKGELFARMLKRRLFFWQKGVYVSAKPSVT